MIAIGRHDKNDLSTEYCLVMAGCAALAFYSVFPKIWSSDHFGIGLLIITTISSLFLGWLAAKSWVFMMRRLVIPAVLVNAAENRHVSELLGLPRISGAPLKLTVAMGPWESFHFASAVMFGTWPRRIKTFCASLAIVVPSIVYGVKTGNLLLASSGWAEVLALVMAGLMGVMGIALLACLAWAAGHWIRVESLKRENVLALTESEITLGTQSAGEQAMSWLEMTEFLATSRVVVINFGSGKLVGFARRVVDSAVVCEIGNWFSQYVQLESAESTRVG